MKTTRLFILIALSSGTLLSAQAQDRAQIEHELAVTAYNYAVGCAERGKYNEALEGLTHIPGGRLNEQQLGWVDSLRTKCELMAGHPMPAHEIPLAESELIDIDDQSAAFIHGIQAYRKGEYATAKGFFTEAIDLDDGPREQVRIEAFFWRGQCEYQLGNYAACCQDLISFNDVKNERTELQYYALAYYTMGYARMHEKKWRHSRINFERYLENQPLKQLASYRDAENRLKECKALEATESLRKVDQQKSKEEEEREAAIEKWRNWRPPYIQ